MHVDVCAVSHGDEGTTTLGVCVEQSVWQGLTVRPGVGPQVLLPLAGLFDVAKERSRLSKQRAKLDKELAGISARLNNPDFMAKASPEVGQEWGRGTGAGRWACAPEAVSVGVTGFPSGQQGA